MKTISSLVVIFLLILIFQTNKLVSGHDRSNDQDTVKNNNNDENSTTTGVVVRDKKRSYNGGSGSYRWGWGGGGGGKGKGREGRGEFVKREYAECKGRGKCSGKRLECPQHCGGLCFYDCLFLCKPHCRR